MENNIKHVGNIDNIDKLVSAFKENQKEHFKNENCFEQMVNSSDYIERIRAAEHGKGLDVLMHDAHEHVRCAVVRNAPMEILDEMISDHDKNVRAEIAKLGFSHHLDKLVNDESLVVRCEVAKQGRKKDLLKLVNDEAFIVRLYVSKHEDKDVLKHLVRDDSMLIRAQIAEKGYFLDEFAHDYNSSVQSAIKDYLKIHQFQDVDTWAAFNPDKRFHNSRHHLTSPYTKADITKSLKVRTARSQHEIKEI